MRKLDHLLQQLRLNCRSQVRVPIGILCKPSFQEESINSSEGEKRKKSPSFPHLQELGFLQKKLLGVEVAGEAVGVEVAETAGVEVAEIVGVEVAREVAGSRGKG